MLGETPLCVIYALRHTEHFLELEYIMFEVHIL